MTAKIFLIVIGFLFLLYLFNRPLNILSQIAADISGTALAVVLTLVRAIFLGMVVYYFFVFVGHFARISTFSDVWTVLFARPSQQGASGFWGVILGLLVALNSWFYRSRMNVQSGQGARIRGRGMLSDPHSPKRLSFSQRCRNFLIRFTR